jgi:replication factor C subunit 3/5
MHCGTTLKVVLKNLATELIASLETNLKVEVSRHAAEFEHRMQRGSKPIFHLEAFVAKFMQIYKRFLLQMDFCL